MQCQPVPFIWQPDNLAQEPNAIFVAPFNGLRGFYPLVFLSTLAVDLQDATGNAPNGLGATYPALGGISGPLSGWSGIPTYADDIHLITEGSALFTGLEGALKTDSAAMLNPASVAIRVWFKFSSKVGAQRLINYAATGGGTVYTLRYSSVTDRLNWHILDSGQTHEVIVTASTLGSPAVDVWHLAYCYYDATTKRAGIQVRPRDGISVAPWATDETAVPFGKNTAGGQFNVAYGPSNERFKGKLMGVGIWARPLNFLELDRVAAIGGYPWPVFTPAAGESGVEVEAPAPAAPSNLQVSGDGATYIWLENFTDNTGGLYAHEVWLSDVTGRNWQLLATLDPGVNGGIWSAAYDSDLQSVRVRAIGRGNPSAWATAIAPDAYYFEGGAVLLKAPDDFWYFVRMETETGGAPDGSNLTTLAIDPTPYSAPAYGAEFLSLLIGATPWGAHLVFDEDHIDDEPGHLQFQFVQDGAASALASIDIASNDGQAYGLSLGLDDDNKPTALPAQTPTVS